MPPVAPILRASLMSKPAANGYNGVFHRPCKKIVLDYCETWGSSEGMRSFIQSEKAGPASIAERHPEVEVVVRRRPFKHPVLRGLYLNNRDKVICVRNLQPASIAQKIQLLLDSSGDKLRKEKGHPVKSTNESVRGIYSPFHAPYSGASNMGPLR